MKTFGKYQLAICLFFFTNKESNYSNPLKEIRRKHNTCFTNCQLLTVNLPNGNEFVYILRCYPNLTGPHTAASRDKISLPAEVSCGTHSSKAA